MTHGELESQRTNPTYTYTRRSKRCDRIRAAVIALEGWDRYRALCTSPVERFDMMTWHCGTTACAAGYLALLPPFRAEGLVIRQYYERVGVPVYSRGGYPERETNALEAFFGVEYDVAASWFLPSRWSDDCKVTARMVADRMRAYLRVHGEETGTVAPRKQDRRPHFLSGVSARG